LVAAALMVLVAPAGATTLTSPSGSNYTSSFKLASEGTLTFTDTIREWKCEWILEGKVEAHGSSVTAGGKVSTLTIPSLACLGGPISILSTGSLEFHTDSESADGNGIVTWVGFEMTIKYENLGVSCKYGTGAGAKLGTLTGSKSTGSNATVHVESFNLPRTGHSIFCGEGATMTGSFKVVTPSYLDVD
ncbi:MAG TPA: hypothetical protein VIL21_07775, partial [Solirubrobacterales bacterium]